MVTECQNSYKSIPFFEWYSDRKNIESECQCLVIDQSSFRSYKTRRGEEILSHPPPRTCDIEMENEDNAGATETMSCSPYILIGTPFSSTVPASAQQIGVVMKQNNYTNAYLRTVGDQLDRIEANQYQDLTRTVPETIPTYKTTSRHENRTQEPQPSYQPNILLFPDTTGIEKCFDSHNLLDTEELLKLLEERLSQTQIPKPESQTQPEVPTQPEVQTLDTNIDTSSEPSNNEPTESFDQMIYKLTNQGTADNNSYT